MRSTIAIAVVSIVVAATLPAAAQQPPLPAPPAAPVQPAPPAQVPPPVQPALPAQRVVPTTPAVQPKQTARTVRASGRRTGRVGRHRHESICSIVNGWRAFNNPYDPKGYFYTGRVCCCG